MDRMIYLGMTGAKTNMQRQDVLANNLANASTTGFRAELQAVRAVPVRGDGASTRVRAGNHRGLRRLGRPDQLHRSQPRCCHARQILDGRARSGRHRGLYPLWLADREHRRHLDDPERL